MRLHHDGRRGGAHRRIRHKNAAAGFYIGEQLVGYMKWVGDMQEHIPVKPAKVHEIRNFCSRRHLCVRPAVQTHGNNICLAELQIIGDIGHKRRVPSVEGCYFYPIDPYVGNLHSALNFKEHLFAAIGGVRREVVAIPADPLVTVGAVGADLVFKLHHMGERHGGPGAIGKSRFFRACYVAQVEFPALVKPDVLPRACRVSCR